MTTSQRVGARRAAGALLALACLATLAGCGGKSVSVSVSTSVGVTATGTTTTTSESDPVRQNLSKALTTTSPALAGLVANPSTTLAPMAWSWLTRWTVYDVQNGSMPRPQRFFAALSDAGEAVVLAGQPRSFAHVLATSQVRVSTAAIATEVARALVDTTRTFTEYSYRVDAVGDVKWKPSLDGAETQAVKDFSATYAAKLTPPQATRSGDAWMVTVWTITGTRLVRHDVTVAADGSAITEQASRVAENLPVPASG